MASFYAHPTLPLSHKSPKHHSENCHQHLPCVRKISNPDIAYDLCYYIGFEYHAVADIAKVKLSPDAVNTYLEPYLKESIYHDTFPTYLSKEAIKKRVSNFNESDTLIKICDACESLTVCSEDMNVTVGKSKSAIFCMVRHYILQIKNIAFCDSLRCPLRSSCIKTPSNKRPQTIQVYDLRFMGHPTVVNIQYEYYRCDHRAHALSTLAGIYPTSNTRNRRFSCRLVTAINDALAKRYRVTYISEATSIPLNTLYHWEHLVYSASAERHETKLLHAKYFSASGFTETSVPLTIRRRKYILIFSESNNKISLSSIYTQAEWQAMANLARGTQWEDLDISDERLLNLAFDYYITEAPFTAFPAPIALVHLYRWTQNPQLFGKNLLSEKILSFMQSNTFPISPDIAACYDECIRFLKNSISNLDYISFLKLMNAFYCFYIPSDRQDFPAFISQWDDFVENQLSNASFGLRISLDISSPSLPLLLQAIKSSALPSKKIVARLLHFNPISLPHITDSNNQTQYLFTEYGDFDYDLHTTETASLDELLSMVQAGLLEDCLPNMP